MDGGYIRSGSSKPGDIPHPEGQRERVEAALEAALFACREGAALEACLRLAQLAMRIMVQGCEDKPLTY